MQGKNWKTSLAGAIIGGGYAALSALQNGIKPRDVLIAAGLVAMGILSKDFNVTGGAQQ